ncbi:MAG: endonuclease MutS2 [Bacteroidota bacterium]
MKCKHPNTYEKLGFDQILEDLKKRILHPEAQEQVDEIRPYSRIEDLLPELKKVAEYVALEESDERFPTGGQVRIKAFLEKLEIKGNWLSLAEIWKLKSWLSFVEGARKFIKNKGETSPLLHQLLFSLEFNGKLIRDIEQVVDNRGELRDDASPELGRIRREMKKASSSLRNALHRILKQAKEEKWSQGEEITMRNDRLVIPVKTDFKSKVPGFVQDVSQSGGTVFVEPAEVLPMNNRVRELQISEHNEIARILQNLSLKVREELPLLTKFRERVVELALIRGKALQAISFEASLPQIEEHGKSMKIMQGFYAPLLLKAKQEKVEVVPLDISLNKGKRIIIISGPNAGGKSVALKAVGLLQLMLQSGMLVPVHPDSRFILFKELYLDIGDEQSVDNDLSTYTSHLYQWRRMGDQMKHSSLFLIDEFGSGTDPRQGAAIAESFLERFVRVGAYGIITTHYGNLKDFAEVNPGTANAAMQFDTRELKPTYRLIEGMPGRSYAFEMANRVGVHKVIIKNAKSKVGGDEMESEQLLKELERKNSRLNRLLQENEKKEKTLKRLLKENESLQSNLSKNRKQMIREAKREAESIIDRANKDVERTIREIKEAKADKEKTKQLRKKLEAAKPKLKKEEIQDEAAEKLATEQTEKEQVKILKGEEPVPGDWVLIHSSNTRGILAEKKGKHAVVEVGELRMSLKSNQISKLYVPKEKKKKVLSSSRLTSGVKHAKTELDLMGMRVEEAIPALDKMIDDARYAGLSQIRILHGKGTGVLREVIRKHLLDFNFVKSVKDAPIEFGGSGWTICEFKQ